MFIDFSHSKKKKKITKVLKWKLVTQLCPTFCDFMACSLPGSSVHGILQARILEGVAILLFRGSSQPRDQTCVSCIAGRFFIVWSTREMEWLKGTCIHTHKTIKYQFYFHSCIYHLEKIVLLEQPVKFRRGQGDGESKRLFPKPRCMHSKRRIGLIIHAVSCSSALRQSGNYCHHTHR